MKVQTPYGVSVVPDFLVRGIRQRIRSWAIATAIMGFVVGGYIAQNFFAYRAVGSEIEAVTWKRKYDAAMRTVSDLEAQRSKMYADAIFQGRR